MRSSRLFCIWLIALAASKAVIADDAAVERGRYLSGAAGCVSCHTDAENDGLSFAGGHRLETPFGIFVVPNITPDTGTGIGDWSDNEFVAAVLHGESPSGGYFYPAFPYPSYAGMREQDALDIKAYLDSLKPVTNKTGEHELSWYVPGRWAMSVWQIIFSPWDFSPLPADSSETMQRGAYLVRHLGHCGECHTPRNALGALISEQELTGAPKQGELAGAPDITSNKDTGIGDWSATNLELFLDLGMLPNGDFAGSNMAAVIDHTTSQLTTEDRQAMVTFLRNISSTPED